MQISTTNPWYREIKVAFAAADRGREVLLKHYGRLSQVSEKKRAGLVTEADQNSEIVIRKYLSENFPEHSILGEEQGLSSVGKSSRLWIIDPLDGTTNYVHQFPFFCISIGFECEGKVVAGVVDAPLMKWRFSAVEGGGAWLNGERLQVSSRKKLSDCLLATGFAYHYDTDQLNSQMGAIHRIVPAARGIRRAGSAALDLCMVAQGIFDGYWEASLKPWDTAAGCLIAAEAGAKVTDYHGDVYTPHKAHIIASNPLIHRELLEQINGANL